MSDPTLLETSPSPTGVDPGTSGTPPAPVNPPSPQGWVSEDGNFSDGWLDRLPQELEPAKATLGKYRSFPELAKAHISLQQLLGKKSNAVNIPGEGATPEEITAYRKALGVPEKAEEYKLKPEQLPQGIEWDENLEKTFSQIAHKHHVSPAAMKELTAVYVDAERIRSEATVSMIHSELEKGRETLKKTWGADHDKRIGLAVRAAKTIGLDPESPGLRDPNVVIALERMAGLMSEDKLISGDFSPTDRPGKARAIAIMKGSDPSVMHLHELYRKSDPEVVKQVRDMLKHG